MGHRTDAELVHHHLGSLTDPLGECGEGVLKLGDLLDAHPRRHTGRDHLDHFGRVLAEHVSADNLPSRGLDYQLAEPFRLPVGDGPQHVLIAGHRDGAVVAGAGLLLGEPDAAVLGVGETAGGDDFMDDPPTRAEHRVLGGDTAFERCAAHEHAVPIDVAGGEDVGDVRGSERVDDHVATLGCHAGGGGVDEVGVAGPADGEECCVHVDRSGLLAQSVQDADTGLERLELVHCCAGDDLDPRPRKACSSATETSISARCTIRGPCSTRVTSQPKSARIDVSWQPVSAAPMTQTRLGREFRLRRSS